MLYALKCSLTDKYESKLLGQNRNVKVVQHVDLYYVDVEYFIGGCLWMNNSYKLLPIYLVICNFIHEVGIHDFVLEL